MLPLKRPESSPGIASKKWSRRLSLLDTFKVFSPAISVVPN
jgi:hypothetical protein